MTDFTAIQRHELRGQADNDLNDVFASRADHQALADEVSRLRDLVLNLEAKISKRTIFDEHFSRDETNETSDIELSPENFKKVVFSLNCLKCDLKNALKNDIFESKRNHFSERLNNLEYCFDKQTKLLENTTKQIDDENIQLIIHDIKEANEKQKSLQNGDYEIHQQDDFLLTLKEEVENLKKSNIFNRMSTIEKNISVHNKLWNQFATNISSLVSIDTNFQASDDLKYQEELKATNSQFSELINQIITQNNNISTPKAKNCDISIEQLCLQFNESYSLLSEKIAELKQTLENEKTSQNGNQQIIHRIESLEKSSEKQTQLWNQFSENVSGLMSIDLSSDSLDDETTEKLGLLKNKFGKVMDKFIDSKQTPNNEITNDSHSIRCMKHEMEELIHRVFHLEEDSKVQTSLWNQFIQNIHNIMTFNPTDDSSISEGGEEAIKESQNQFASLISKLSNNDGNNMITAESPLPNAATFVNEDVLTELQFLKEKVNEHSKLWLTFENNVKRIMSRRQKLSESVSSSDEMPQSDQTHDEFVNEMQELIADVIPTKQAQFENEGELQKIMELDYTIKGIQNELNNLRTNGESDRITKIEEQMKVLIELWTKFAKNISSLISISYADDPRVSEELTKSHNEFVTLIEKLIKQNIPHETSEPSIVSCDQNIMTEIEFIKAELLKMKSEQDNNSNAIIENNSESEKIKNGSNGQQQNGLNEEFIQEMNLFKQDTANKVQKLEENVDIQTSLWEQFSRNINGLLSNKIHEPSDSEAEALQQCHDEIVDKIEQLINLQNDQNSTPSHAVTVSPIIDTSDQGVNGQITSLSQEIQDIHEELRQLQERSTIYAVNNDVINSTNGLSPIDQTLVKVLQDRVSQYQKDNEQRFINIERHVDLQTQLWEQFNANLQGLLEVQDQGSSSEDGSSLLKASYDEFQTQMNKLLSCHNSIAQVSPQITQASLDEINQSIVQLRIKLQNQINQLREDLQKRSQDKTKSSPTYSEIDSRLPLQQPVEHSHSFSSSSSSSGEKSQSQTSPDIVEQQVEDRHSDLINHQEINKETNTQQTSSSSKVEQQLEAGTEPIQQDLETVQQKPEADEEQGLSSHSRSSSSQSESHFATKQPVETQQSQLSTSTKGSTSPAENNEQPSASIEGEFSHVSDSSSSSPDERIHHQQEIKPDLSQSLISSIYEQITKVEEDINSKLNDMCRNYQLELYQKETEGKIKQQVYEIDRIKLKLTRIEKETSIQTELWKQFSQNVNGLVKKTDYSTSEDDDTKTFNNEIMNKINELVQVKHDNESAEEKDDQLFTKINTDLIEIKIELEQMKSERIDLTNSIVSLQKDITNMNEKISSIQSQAQNEIQSEILRPTYENTVEPSQSPISSPDIQILKDKLSPIDQTLVKVLQDRVSQYQKDNEQRFINIERHVDLQTQLWEQFNANLQGLLEVQDQGSSSEDGSSLLKASYDEFQTQMNKLLSCQDQITQNTNESYSKSIYDLQSQIDKLKETQSSTQNTIHELFTILNTSPTTNFTYNSDAVTPSSTNNQNHSTPVQNNNSILFNILSDINSMQKEISEMKQSLNSGKNANESSASKFQSESTENFITQEKMGQYTNEVLNLRNLFNEILHSQSSSMEAVPYSLANKSESYAFDSNDEAPMTSATDNKSYTDAKSYSLTESPPADEQQSEVSKHSVSQQSVSSNKTIPRHNLPNDLNNRVNELTESVKCIKHEVKNIISRLDDITFNVINNNDATKGDTNGAKSDDKTSSSIPSQRGTRFVTQDSINELLKQTVKTNEEVGLLNRKYEIIQQTLDNQNSLWTQFDLSLHQLLAVSMSDDSPTLQSEQIESIHKAINCIKHEIKKCIVIQNKHNIQFETRSQDELILQTEINELLSEVAKLRAVCATFNETSNTREMAESIKSLKNDVEELKQQRNSAQSSIHDKINSKEETTLYVNSAVVERSGEVINVEESFSHSEQPVEADKPLPVDGETQLSQSQPQPQPQEEQNHKQISSSSSSSSCSADNEEQSLVHREPAEQAELTEKHSIESHPAIVQSQPTTEQSTEDEQPTFEQEEQPTVEEEQQSSIKVEQSTDDEQSIAKEEQQPSIKVEQSTEEEQPIAKEEKPTVEEEPTVEQEPAADQKANSNISSQHTAYEDQPINVPSHESTISQANKEIPDEIKDTLVTNPTNDTSFASQSSLDERVTKVRSLYETIQHHSDLMHHPLSEEAASSSSYLDDRSDISDLSNRQSTADSEYGARQFASQTAFEQLVEEVTKMNSIIQQYEDDHDILMSIDTELKNHTKPVDKQVPETNTEIMNEINTLKQQLSQLLNNITQPTSMKLLSASSSSDHIIAEPVPSGQVVQPELFERNIQIEEGKQPKVDPNCSSIKDIEQSSPVEADKPLPVDGETQLSQSQSQPQPQEEQNHKQISSSSSSSSCSADNEEQSLVHREPAEQAELTEKHSIESHPAIVQSQPTTEQSTEGEQSTDDEQPIAKEEEPTVEQEQQPSIKVEQPIAKEEQPTVEEEQPIAKEEKPTVGEEEQPIAKEEKPTVEEQSIAKEEQPTVEQEQSIAKEEKPTVEEQSIAKEEQPTVEQEQSIAKEEKPTVEEEEQPIAKEEQSTEQEQSTEDEQPIAKEEQPYDGQLHEEESNKITSLSSSSSSSIHTFDHQQTSEDQKEEVEKLLPPTLESSSNETKIASLIEFCQALGERVKLLENSSILEKTSLPSNDEEKAKIHKLILSLEEAVERQEDRINLIFNGLESLEEDETIEKGKIYEKITSQKQLLENNVKNIEKMNEFEQDITTIKEQLRQLKENQSTFANKSLENEIQKLNQALKELKPDDEMMHITDKEHDSTVSESSSSSSQQQEETQPQGETQQQEENSDHTMIGSNDEVIAKLVASVRCMKHQLKKIQNQLDESMIFTDRAVEIQLDEFEDEAANNPQKNESPAEIKDNSNENSQEKAQANARNLPANTKNDIEYLKKLYKLMNAKINRLVNDFQRSNKEPTSSSNYPSNSIHHKEQVSRIDELDQQIDRTSKEFKALTDQIENIQGIIAETIKKQLPPQQIFDTISEDIKEIQDNQQKIDELSTEVNKIKETLKTLNISGNQQICSPEESENTSNVSAPQSINTAPQENHEQQNIGNEPENNHSDSQPLSNESETQKDESETNSIDDAPVNADIEEPITNNEQNNGQEAEAQIINEESHHTDSDHSEPNTQNDTNNTANSYENHQPIPRSNTTTTQMSTNNPESCKAEIDELKKSVSDLSNELRTVRSMTVEPFDEIARIKQQITTQRHMIDDLQKSNSPQASSKNKSIDFMMISDLDTLKTKFAQLENRFDQFKMLYATMDNNNSSSLSSSGLGINTGNDYNDVKKVLMKYYADIKSMKQTISSMENQMNRLDYSVDEIKHSPYIKRDDVNIEMNQFRTEIKELQEGLKNSKSEQARFKKLLQSHASTIENTQIDQEKLQSNFTDIPDALTVLRNEVNQLGAIIKSQQQTEKLREHFTHEIDGFRNQFSQQIGDLKSQVSSNVTTSDLAKEIESLKSSLSQANNTINTLKKVVALTAKKDSEATLKKALEQSINSKMTHELEKIRTELSDSSIASSNAANKKRPSTDDLDAKVQLLEVKIEELRCDLIVFKEESKTFCGTPKVSKKTSQAAASKKDMESIQDIFEAVNKTQLSLAQLTKFCNKIDDDFSSIKTQLDTVRREVKKQGRASVSSSLIEPSPPIANEIDPASPIQKRVRPTPQKSGGSQRKLATPKGK